jgi:hypothetical protein
MKFVFCNLPHDIINNILLYNEHFIMRKGVIISIIPKTDNRYKLLKFITLKLGYIENFNNEIRYNYYFHNLYDYEGRQQNNSDLFQVTINENNENNENRIIKYSIWIGKQYPKSFICNKKQNYYIENPVEYNWIYNEFEYVRT